MTGRLLIDLPDELVEAIAAGVAEILETRQAPPAEHGWLRGAEAIADYIGSPRSRVYTLRLGPANPHPP